MKTQISLAVVTTLSLSAINIPASLAATPCSVATVKGAFGELTDGSDTNFSHVTAVTRAVFDGKGNVRRSGFISNDGNIQETSDSGTYTVQNDCTINLIEGNKNTYTTYGVIVNQGKKIYAMRIGDGENRTLIFERIH